MKNIVCLFALAFVFASGCNETYNQIKPSSETQKLIDSMPQSVNTDYTVYLSLAGDCRSGSIYVTVETTRGTERRVLKTFQSEDGTRIEGQKILKYIEECNELHNKVNKVRAEASATAFVLKGAKEELVTADLNVTNANSNLNGAIKAENDSRTEIGRLKALLQEQENVYANKIIVRKNAERELNDKQNVLLAKKNTFNEIKSRIESINDVILGIVEQIGQANGKNKGK